MRILDAFVKAGSHYMTRAEWGCLDDDHRSWIIVEADDDVQAHHMVPPVLRSNAKVIRLFEFNGGHIDLLHQLPHEQFLQLRKLSYQQLLEVFSASANQVRDVVHRLLENASSASE